MNGSQRLCCHAILFVFWWGACASMEPEELLSRNKRFLIFPRQAPTRHQFIAGIGIPADLEYESLTIGYVLKAEFWLPYNASVFRENPFFPEYRNSDLYLGARKMFSKAFGLRWDIYAYVIDRLERYGYKGRDCLLKAICEMNSMQDLEHIGVLEELLHVLFRPSSSVDLEKAGSQDFKDAETIGQNGGSCNFYSCNISLLDFISKMLNVND